MKCPNCKLDMQDYKYSNAEEEDILFWLCGTRTCVFFGIKRYHIEDGDIK